MRRLDPSSILRLWETGQGRRPHERAVALLAAAAPERTAEEWEALALGRRDAALLALYQASFGADLAAFAECPRCAERLELTLAIDELRSPETAPQAPLALDDAFDVADAAGRTWRCRLPNTADLAAVAAARTDVPGARRLLARRCVVAGPEGAAAATAEPSAAAVEQLCQEIERRDPMAVMTFGLRCPACGHAWASALDVGAFLWERVSALAKRLLREVDALARAYGWSEGQVLALSPWRRQCYVELAGG